MTPSPTPTPLLNAKQTAAWLATSEAALSQLRYRHEGPAYVRLGRAVRYRQADVEDFITAAIVRTSR
ncbi:MULTISPECIES: AlpA family transcriptional regulator [Cryobacterium]|uniref:DNA-binding protein n=1 Tax=Cryobacterium glucosi TaxID=1259175 RepID=A0ABY2IQP1_9MICO|nr:MULTISPECIES: helix-turn-helix domain-containing protein [Cryobacterium]TFB99729.1 DNA-binding protein [Cryobacterium sp. MDB2-A-1]TFC09712.1 DNA-binding protein [Cryobacterium sp. MDB2-A-2]TFC13544.1 DNA-binding protein [Cryobacterium sp. MDB2-10]TFC22662.1 DNA-binding protein [Cryobacterium glucosi]